MKPLVVLFISSVYRRRRQGFIGHRRVDFLDGDGIGGRE